MTVEEFSDKYENEDTLEIFDEICEFFSQELPQKFFDDWVDNPAHIHPLSGQNPLI